MGCKVFLEMNRVASRAVRPTARTLYNSLLAKALVALPDLTAPLADVLGGMAAS